MLTRGGHLTGAFRNDPAETRRYWATVDPYFIAPGSEAAHLRAAVILEASPHNLASGRGRFITHAPPALTQLGSLHMSTLVLAGEHDIPDVHAHAGAIAAGIPHARREVMSDSGHVPYFEQPAAFVRTVLPFIQNAEFLGVLDHQGTAAASRLIRSARAADPAAVVVAEGELNARGYRLIARGEIPEAVAVLRLNVEAFPASANTHDSLGEALLAAGDRDQAIVEYRRALEIDPGSRSARAALEKLGAILEAVSGVQ
jgi:tetratricopeptide (TPR) repeat protein